MVVLENLWLVSKLCASKHNDGPGKIYSSRIEMGIVKKNKVDAKIFFNYIKNIQNKPKIKFVITSDEAFINSNDCGTLR